MNIDLLSKPLPDGRGFFVVHAHFQLSDPGFGFRFPAFSKILPAVSGAVYTFVRKANKICCMNQTLIYSLFGLALLSTGCGTEKSVSEKPLRIEVACVSEGESATRKEFPFISKPLRTSELSFRVSGPVDRFDAYAGNFYKQGSIIAEIDPRDFRMRKEHTEAVLRQAKAEFERIEALYRKDNVSASAYEKVRAEYIAAKTAFDKAAADLEDTRLVAPFDGYVGEVFIEKFQDVRAAQPVLTFVDISKLRIEVYVTQDVVMQAGKLNTVGLAFDARPNQVFSADLAEYARSTTPNNLSYLLTALLPNPGGRMPAGMSGKVFFDIPGSQRRNVLIPQTALCHQPTSGDYVWVVDTARGTVSRRNITLGNLQPGGRFSVTSGLQPGEIIAVSGLRFLSDGMEVEISDKPQVQPVKIAG